MVQEYLQKKKIKFRPIKPLSPHLNGKVERVQRTDLDEFYSSTDLKDQELQSKLMIWEEYYTLHGRTPWEKYKELEHTIPSIEKVHKSYDSSKEIFAIQNYKYNQGFKAAIKNKIY